MGLSRSGSDDNGVKTCSRALRLPRCETRGEFDRVGVMRVRFLTGLAIMWLAILLCFDVVFVTLSLWTFESVMTD